MADNKVMPLLDQMSTLVGQLGGHPGQCRRQVASFLSGLVDVDERAQGQRGPQSQCQRRRSRRDAASLLVGQGSFLVV